MTDRDDMMQRIEDALERYEREQMKPLKRLAWGRMRQGCVRLPMMKPKRAKLLRVWGADDARG
jgi:hypothetical protein